MSMKFKDLYGKVKNQMSFAFSLFYQDTWRRPKGEVFFRLEHEDGRVETRHITNVITKDFSILVARLLKDPLEPRYGMFGLALGTGDVGWDLQNPDAADNNQRSLYAEVGRKTFSSVVFVDGAGDPVAYPTNVIDFTTTFAESEAVGALVEMGLVGGDTNDNVAVTNPVTPANGPYDATVDITGKDTLCNYLTFPVINKPATARLVLTWRLTL